MDRLIRFLKRDDVGLYLTLAFLVVIIYLMRGFATVVLLTVIFAFLAVKVSHWLNLKTHLPYWIAVIVVYVAVLGVLIAALSYAAPTLVTQLKVIPDMLAKAITNHPVLNKNIDKWINQAIHSSELIQNGKSLLLTGIKEAGQIGTGFTHVLMAIFLSFIFTLTRGRMVSFGRQFLRSKFSKFFNNVYFLTRKFVLILGKIIETQLIICTINTILMTIGFVIIGMPSIMVLSIIVFILGLVPVAGVLLSMIPLTLLAFASGGLIRVVEIIMLVIIIHAFESYFLHPRLMADRTDLPVFATFITLIIMESLLGAWGLIVGIPIVAFALDILGVQDSERKRIVSK
ncbi:AI-2E family transporter [Lactiplantibacillus mudanjiangensis]|uniref:AI-2E family transporter [Lactobacillus sp.] n=1 Tax=Lactiplantibacillus mudanjiangensis TaxID=1296538 RepID=A0A660DV42_9LACO|nr:AI-2E family transporter [Lactiplantibacillus mudanjiangensis]VDG20367.1 AI-2E family transporter [Lactobacillus sp.] [Lactiplantibacillus mudanjiangensis]VDG23937.1 AI-2E family transporter [Lactobacillus sp.] [Lactiplantibacillus mudanjiangensis]VDG27117.1 AI-2E family transporter [Lactobacillus sp.] [Lactiplantibacillus mudanjiangensis]VDG33980.1 AI-2E family transporter [Lactobacillus sp.] [Lactiplantibacillus mudanjiangensis]